MVIKKCEISLQLLYDFSAEIRNNSLKLKLLLFYIYECKHSKISEENAHVIIYQTWLRIIYKWGPQMVFQRIKKSNYLKQSSHYRETLT